MCSSGEEGPPLLLVCFCGPEERLLEISPQLEATQRRLHLTVEVLYGDLVLIILVLKFSMWALTLGLKDTYLHVPIALVSQRFLAYE